MKTREIPPCTHTHTHTRTHTQRRHAPWPLPIRVINYAFFPISEYVFSFRAVGGRTELRQAGSGRPFVKRCSTTKMFFRSSSGNNRGKRRGGRKHPPPPAPGFLLGLRLRSGEGAKCVILVRTEISTRTKNAGGILFIKKRYCTGKERKET